MKDEKKEDDPTIHKARQGLLKAMVDHNLLAKFSSTPIADDAFARKKSASTAALLAATPESAVVVSEPGASNPRTFVSQQSGLTDSERGYLQILLQKGDASTLEKASQRLNDASIFPKLAEEELAQHQKISELDKPGAAKKQKRNSQVQQHLFRLHERVNAVAPSLALQRMSLVHKNSILESFDETLEDIVSRDGEETVTSFGSGGDYGRDWNPFRDISSWLDGSEGFEVNGRGSPLPTNKTSGKSRTKFRILGTAADDVSCHPHVLSPPLMESLSAFLPETVSDQNFWLKYSMVRDGANLWTFLRNTRASSHSFIAIETVDGHVLGAFTSHPWRLSQGWYGSAETFLWKMRRSRLHDGTTSIVEQACQESEIQVFPYRSGSTAVQYCSKECVMLGQGELLPSTKAGNHLGHGLYFDSNLRTGSTSTSETFGNPCLVDTELRGASFEIANMEVWAMTPHKNVADAEQRELSVLFLEGARDGGDKDMNVMDILVGAI